MLDLRLRKFNFTSFCI